MATHGLHRSFVMPSLHAHIPRGSSWVRALSARGALLAVLWAVLVEFHPEGLWVGLVAVPLAVGASLVLSPPGPVAVRPWALARFLPGVLWRGLSGSLDVALRALRPVLAVAPGYVDAPVRLASPPARVFLSSVASLIPGTLGVDMGEDRLTLHLLDVRGLARETALRDLRALERGVATVFGLAPPPGEAP